MLSTHQVSDKVRTIRTTCTTRDQTMADIHAVRNGNIQDVFPGLFSDDFPAPVIANFIDIAARDVAESLAPLPSFSCSASNMVSDKARGVADKRTKGGSYYLQKSQVQRQMYSAADYFASYGFLPVLVEPDFDEKVPRIQFLDPRATYYERDRYGRCTMFAKIFKKSIAELCALYPEHAGKIAGPMHQPSSTNLIELVLYRDDDQTCMFIPERKDLTLHWATNPIGECPVVIAERPGVTDKPRGQFDDVMWIQVARNRFAMLAMQSAEQVVDAPLAVPMDVQDFAIGPLAAIRSNNPEKIRKVAQELPQAAFVEGQQLDAEMQRGARYPEVRTGNLDASIITGQGVRALEGGFDSQIRSAQDVFAEAFTEVMRIAFKTDEKLWPNHERSIRGLQDGVPYEIKWRPSRDINGDHSCDVTYGFAAGLDPNRSLVFILQLLGGGLISKDMARRQFPFAINVTQEEQRIEIENLRDALIQSVAGYAQAVPVLAQSGQDPGEVLSRLAVIIEGRQKGKPLEKVVAEAFAPQAPPPQAPGSGGADPLSAPGGPGGGLPGMDPSGLPPGVAPGQATMGPGGSPDLLSLLAGLNSGGGPSLNTNVKRNIPA